jgi:hypothetical protein
VKNGNGPTIPVNVLEIKNLKQMQREQLKMISKMEENEFKKYYQEKRSKK